MANLAFRHVGALIHQRFQAISGWIPTLPLLAPFRGIAMAGNLGRGQADSYRIQRGSARVDASFIAFSTLS
jgi:hypothetical protein